jgi:ferric-dicitrate binding protein FerR (iron transport regulator)
MSEPDDRLSTEERRVAERVRRLSAPRPDPAYRARLQREFVAGTLASPSAVIGVAPPAERPRTLWDTLLIPAAVGVLVLGGLIFNRGPGWQVLDVAGSGAMEVNGRSIPLSERGRLGRALAGGARLRLPEGASLTVTAPGRLAVEITSGTEAALSAPPARWLGRIATAQVSSGEIRITTGARFHGSRLDVKTPEAAVEVTGTTLAVICEPTGTCVCVMAGVVRVGARGQPMVAVPAGRRRYVFHDGRRAEQAEMRPIERVKLGEMERQNPAGVAGGP